MIQDWNWETRGILALLSTLKQREFGECAALAQELQGSSIQQDSKGKGTVS